MKQSAKMKMLDMVSQSGNGFEIKEEKPDILSSNKVNHGFSSLVFEDSGKTTEQLINEYARLFVDSLMYELHNESRNKEGSYILQSINKRTSRRWK